MDSRYGETRFGDFTHAQLAQMLAAGRPADVLATAGAWRDVANDLDAMALAVERQHERFRGYWSGPAAQAHAEMITALVDGVQRVAWAARRIADQVAAAGEALRRAQERMASLPAPVELPPPDEALLAAAAAPLPHGRDRAGAAARQAAAFRAIQERRRVEAAAALVTTAAARILTELRDAYRNVDFPRLPAVAEPPTVAADGSAAFSLTGTANGVRPLFDGLWRDGLAAAAGMPPAQLLAPYVDLPPADPPTPPRLDGARRGVAEPSLPRGFASVGGSLHALDDVLAQPVPAVGQASVASALAGPAEVVGAAPMGGPGAAGVPAGAAIPPFLGGFVPPGAGLGGDAGRLGASAAKEWLVGKVTEFDVDSPVVPEVIS